MLISQIIGGYSLGGADLLRRAMGRKKPEEMAEHRELFTEGAKKKGYDPQLATKLFDLMEKFAGYGFNKSHSAAYALIAYHTAWLKAYHPAEFMAATMLSDMDDTDKVHIFYQDAKANGVDILPPDINESLYRFVPVSDQSVEQGLPPRTIRYGLGAIKGTGKAAVDAIVQARESGGPFTGLFDFCRRIDRHVVNKRCIEALIRAGAFDSIEKNRAALLATLPRALEAAEQAARTANQVSLFDDDASDIVEQNLSEVPAWDMDTLLRAEKTAIGFYFSAHLFDVWRDEVRRFAPTPLADLQPSREPQWFAGILQSGRSRNTRRGRMYYGVLEDGTAQVEVAVFNEVYQKFQDLLKEDELVIIRGRVSHDEYSGGLRVSADDIYDLQRAREEHAGCLRLELWPEHHEVHKLHTLLNPFRGEPENNRPGIPVELAVINDKFSCTVRLSTEWNVRLSDALLSQLKRWLGAERIEIDYQKRMSRGVQSEAFGHYYH